MKVRVRTLRMSFLMMLVVLVPTITYADSGSMPKILTAATYGMGSAAYGMISGIASVLSKHLPTEIKVMPTSGEYEILPLVGAGHAEITGTNMWAAKQGFICGKAFKDALGGHRVPARLLTGGSANVNGVITAADSGIKSGKDLKGKRYVCDFGGNPGITAQAEAALANFGLTRNDVRVISVPGPGAGVNAITEGRADASGSAVLGMGAVKELDSKRGARFLSFDPSPAAVKRYRDIFPATLLLVQPEKGREGVLGPTYMMRYEWYLWCNGDLISENTAYQIVKVMWDYNDEITSISARLKRWTRDGFVTVNATIPYHPGAIKFYKEKGLWTGEMETLQKKLLSTQE